MADLVGILCFYLAFAALDRREWAGPGGRKLIRAGLLAFNLALTLAAWRGARLPWPGPLLEQLTQAMPLLAGRNVI